MVEDDNGDLWLDTPCGLVRVSGSDLSKWCGNPACKVRFRVYDAGDGLRRGATAMGYFPRAARSRDGRLWFAVFDGVAVVNPKHPVENRLPPPVEIEEITVGQSAYSIHGGLRLPSLTRELRIDYTAKSFVAPEKVRFRYKLDGFDREWHDAAERRQAVYTNLPPKQYTFRVVASNNDGIWNEQGASFAFAIDPAFYQTIWFRLLSVSAFALLLWSLHRLRLRQMGKQIRVRFQERLAERTRIAGEMHDTLIQNLCGFSLQLEGLAKNATIPAFARASLREIRAETERCLREARELVWDLRSPVLQENGLEETLREAGEQITSGEPVQFHMTVRGDRRPAPPKLQHHLLRIVQEATRNAVRYSNAKEIEMQIAYLDSDRIRVQMRDDGCGFDPEKASRELGHWGLIIMRERARQLGGELKISSAPGRGTELDIVVPISRSSE
jgi:signal transduction histidine kinase